MLPLLAPLAIGAAAGVGKYFLSDKPRYNAEKKLAAETQRYSPWTGLQANTPRNPSMFENVLQGGMTGLQLGQGLQSLGGAASSMAAPSSQAMGGGPSLGVNTDFGVASNFDMGTPTANSASAWSRMMKRPGAFA